MTTLQLYSGSYFQKLHIGVNNYRDLIKDLNVNNDYIVCNISLFKDLKIKL